MSLRINRQRLARSDRKADYQSSSPVLLHPYDTPACIFQHKSLAAHIRKNGQGTTVLMKPIKFTDSAMKSQLQDLTYESFADLTRGILDLCQGDVIFATGVIDSFMSSCQSDVFFGHFVIPASFIELIHATKAQADDLILDHSSLVLADGAYMINRALISSALSAGKKVNIFNPDGDWLEFTSQHGENHRDYHRYLKNLSPYEYKTALDEANAYLDARFTGKQTDLDSPGVFSERVKSIDANPRKVLFLHVFRDANQVPLDQEQNHQSLFSTYFEWADFCLQEMAKKPDEWLVKLHPSSKFYGDEIKIQLRLLRKHGFSMDLVDSCPTTAQILQNRWPIFTHSGTVALESAVFGYRTHVCSRRHPEQLVHLAKSKEQLIEQLNKPPSVAQDSLDTVENETARLLLHWFFKHDLPLLAPKNPQPDRRSPLKFNTSLVAQEFSLMGRYLRPSVQAQLQRMAMQVNSNLK